MYPSYQNTVLGLYLCHAIGGMHGHLFFDLNSPAFTQRQGSNLVLNMHNDIKQQDRLQRSRLKLHQDSTWLRLIRDAERLRTSSLRDSWQFALDRTNPRKPHQGNLKVSLRDPVTRKLFRSGLKLDRRRVVVGVKPLSVTRAGVDFSSDAFALLPLVQRGSQQGLYTLAQLAASSQAVVVAINGGFFNRTRQLPLGALKRDGVWLSGPILNRGAIGWSTEGPLHFGRLRLKQKLQVKGGQSWDLGYLNSAFVRSGLSRYTSAWGPRYQALSGEEKALLIRNGSVVSQFKQSELDLGIPIADAENLLVSRGRGLLPAAIGDQVVFHLKTSDPLGDLPNVLGAGPLLLQGSRIVLSGQEEGFNPTFLRQAAPRSVVAQDARSLWLVAITDGGSGSPTLLETALALLQLRLSDALNLDGGSSTSLLLVDHLLLTGRGIAPRLQNALGLVALPQE
ncbi:hypothetical protein OMCYN_00462 [cyanobiont of Ornithocercus magnificus]|nr:hypothetical protein OMCYN_00462 [cyanobiont of Ornithocercus magnificus]